MPSNRFSHNNFDLIRLVAAMQVAFHHAATHLAVGVESTLFWLTSLLPGVPIFFFVSGFLISKSYESNPRLPEYATNRVLRIYPALLACLALSVLAVSATGYFGGLDLDFFAFCSWLIAQSTFLQFFNPDFMRGFAVGVLNGSLWTISVELQFYIIVPLLYGAIRRCFGGSAVRFDSVLAIFIVLFLVVNRGYVSLEEDFAGLFLYKLLGVSFAPWFYMFLLGVFVQRRFDFFHALLARKALLVLSCYLGVAAVAYEAGARIGNTIGPLLYVGLCAALFSCAYSAPMLSKRILRRNDLSYGIYIYHMPVINLMLFYEFGSRWGDVILVLAASVGLALLSWVCIERPALSLKRHSLNPLDRATQGDAPSPSQW